MGGPRGLAAFLLLLGLTSQVSAAQEVFIVEGAGDNGVDGLFVEEGQGYLSGQKHKFDVRRNEQSPLRIQPNNYFHHTRLHQVLVGTPVSHTLHMPSHC